MNEQLTPQNELKNLNPEGISAMLQALESFFHAYPENVVCHMETMLYDWYTHAQEHYPSGHIDEVVNRTFKVNDLLLKLYDAMLLLKDTDLSPVDELVDGSYELRQVS
jgi:hypothetical protein